MADLESVDIPAYDFAVLVLDLTAGLKSYEDRIAAHLDLAASLNNRLTAIQSGYNKRPGALQRVERRADVAEKLVAAARAAGK